MTSRSSKVVDLTQSKARITFPISHQ